MRGADRGLSGTYGICQNSSWQLTPLWKRAFSPNLHYQGRIDEIIFTLVSGKANMPIQKEILKREGLNCGSDPPTINRGWPEDLAVVDKAHAMIQFARAGIR